LPIFSSNAQEFDDSGRGLSEHHAKPGKFGPPTSDGYSARHENDLIRRAGQESKADIGPGIFDVRCARVCGH
jgi:hypothetical protein